VRIFESGSILLYLADKFDIFIPKKFEDRTECLNWLFWQMASAPYLGGGFGHFYAYAPEKYEYPINRFAMEVKRQLDVLDKLLSDKNFICCDTDENESILNISNNGQSSSILELGTHKKHYPYIKYIDTIKVKNKRIDTMYKEDNIPNTFANFLNIDIQGAELLALKGTGKILHNFDYVYLEVNRDYVYKNCALIKEIDDYLFKFNFKRVESKWTHENWGDALYIKNNN